MTRLASLLMKIRFCAVLVQVMSIVLVCCLCGSQSVRRRPKPSESCPVRLRSNHTGAMCVCSASAVDEIVCSGGVDAVPQFLPNDRLFHALYLTHQNINELIQASFAHLQVLKISLNFNPIGDKLATSALSGLELHLRELQLGACEIQSLPDRLLAGMDLLMSLHLWANHIRHIPTSFFRAAPQLRELLLWGNEIARVDQDTFAGLWKLRKLDLDRNRISSLDKETFRHLSELRVLNLGENRIQALFGDTFVYMRSLRALHLDRNGLGFVYERAFNGLHSLLSLTLDHNNISFIPDHVFSDLRNLTSLDLSSNRLDHVWPRTFTGLRSLVRLQLADNRLTELPEGVLRHSPRLRRLNVDGNALTTLRQCVVARKSRLNVLSLVGNPVYCDCRLEWIAELIRDERTSVWGSCRHKPSTLDDLSLDRTSYEYRLPIITGYKMDHSDTNCLTASASNCLL